MVKWMQKHWKLSLLIFGIVVFIFIIVGTANYRREQKNNENPSDVGGNEDVGTSVGGSETEDSIIMRRQPDLIAKFGNIPDGYLWDIDGTLLSQGDKSMSAEDVLYAYLNGIKSLDFSMAQKYSRGSRVVSTYSSYFDSSNSYTDYADNFMRNMYRQSLLSIQVVGIESSSVFAENKQVFTVDIQILDLTNKDFWKPDKYEIYKNLKIYNSEDSTMSDLYLYNYILEYYKSENAQTRVITVDFTLEKYPDLDTGWLVSIDTDLNRACLYTDGTPVMRYIKDMYNSEGKDLDYIYYDIPSTSEEVTESTEEFSNGISQD